MLRKRFLSVLAVLTAACLMPQAPAWAAPGSGKPAFAIALLSVPTNFAPGDGVESRDYYRVRVTNSGDAPSSGAPITITDTLPAGVLYNALGGHVFEEGVEGEDDRGNFLACSAGPPVSCSYSEVLQPGQSLEMVVPITVPQGAPATVTDSASVSGGGAAGASTSETTTISATLPAFGLQSFDGSILGAGGLPDTQAGSHPSSMTFDLNLNTLPVGLRLDPAGNPKQMTINLPPGIVVNPNATLTRCTEAQLESDLQGNEETDGCPDSSAVGTIRTSLGLAGYLSSQPLPLFNMVPPPGAPAEFGFDVGDSGLYVHLLGGVRTGSDYGLSSTSKDILQEGSLVGIRAELWGDPGSPVHDSFRGRCVYGDYFGKRPCPQPSSGRPLLTMPSACSAPQGTTLVADSWQQPASFIEDGFTFHDLLGNPVGVTGCSALDFSPSLSVQPDTALASSPSGLDVDLRVPQEESVAGLAEANLEKTVVKLPAGMAISPSGANGLGVCTPQQIGLGNGAPSACPDASKVASAEVITPLLDKPLEGSVYVAQQGNNPFASLLALYLAVEGEGVVIKLPGEVSLDPLSGQVTTTFDKSPQLPFGELKLNFTDGPRAALVTPGVCGSYATLSELTPWSRPAPVELSSSFVIAGGCGQGFSPAFSAGTASNQAGAFSPLSVTVSRGDHDQAFSGVTLTTPPGLLGILKGLERCGEPQASQGTCGSGSLIGHATATAGPGSDPVSTSGQVFLTGPYKGAPFGLSVVVPAVAGPFNLGTVVVRAAVSIDPHTAQITVTSDPLPTILQGVPLDIRTVNVTIDRSGFIFNPTSCAPLSLAGVLTSAQGASASVASRFQAASCQGLAFKPSFSVSTQAGTSKKNGASLDVKVGSGAGQANIGRVVVTLPKQLPARLTTIQQACPEATFAANPASCPAGSDIGAATAYTPVLANPLVGPAYLVSHGGAAFPDLDVILQGEGVTLDLVGSIDIKHGVTSSTFASVPDAPISSFELKLPEGPHSGLAAVLPAKAKGSLCGQKLTMPTTITGQNGAQLAQATKIAVIGCPKSKHKHTTKRARRKHGKPAKSKQHGAKKG